MSQAGLLGQRAIREALRAPEALLPTLFIPVFFLVVNVGQAGKIFPSGSTSFLRGQNYGAFQLPSSLLLAASFGSAALYLVEDIEGGYFDKLRAAPVSRSALVLGRLVAEAVKNVGITSVLVLFALPFGITIASGPLGFVLLIVLTASWAVVFAGFMQLIALKTRSAAATNSGGLVFFPLLFLTPNFVPRNLLTRPMEVAATFNPVTYIMEALRSLILQNFAWGAIGRGFAVVAVLGALMLALNVRTIRKLRLRRGLDLRVDDQAVATAGGRAPGPGRTSMVSTLMGWSQVEQCSSTWLTSPQAWCRYSTGGPAAPAVQRSPQPAMTSSRSQSCAPFSVSRYSLRGGVREYSCRARTPHSSSHFSRSVRTLREMPRSAWISSNRLIPTQTSRRISGVHGSPTTLRVRAIEQVNSPKSVRCMKSL
jgi:ABC-2 type transport system permease protein